MKWCLLYWFFSLKTNIFNIFLISHLYFWTFLKISKVSFKIPTRIECRNFTERVQTAGWLSGTVPPPLHQKVYGWCPRNLFEFLYSHWSNSFGKFHYSINGLPPKPILIEVHLFFLQGTYKKIYKKFLHYCIFRRKNHENGLFLQMSTNIHLSRQEFGS